MAFLEGKIVKGVFITIGATLFVMTALAYYLALQEFDYAYPPVIPPHPFLQAADAGTKKLNQQSYSDDVASISKDLQDTQVDALDKEMQDINKELNSF